MLKMFAVAVIVLAVCSAGAFALYEAGKYFDEKYGDIENDMGSFDECVSAGYSVIQVYPKVCVDNLGNSYTEIVIQ